ncbi:MAG: transporter substrate-binding domain-containing protein [Hahellaceae bacterium]|nr:transporter substrate-binding domain-containing protein [Hahellaceae bacterium]
MSAIPRAGSLFSMHFVLIWVIGFWCQLAQAGTIKIGFFSLAPHAMQEASYAPAKGAAVDYVGQYVVPEMAKILGTELDAHFTVLPFSRLLHMLQTGEIDAALTLAKTPEREEIFRYSAEPLTSMQSGLALRKEFPVYFVDTPESLRILRIGFTKDGYVSPWMRDSQIPLQLFVGDKNVFVTLLRVLSAHRLDAVYNPTLITLKYEALKLGISSQLRFLPLPEPQQGLYTVFRHNILPEWLQAFDLAHQRVRERLDYATLLSEYLETARESYAP